MARSEPFLTIWQNVKEFSSRDAAKKAATSARRKYPDYEYRVFPKALSSKFLLFRRKRKSSCGCGHK